MALITDLDDLSQGTETVVGDLAFTSSSGANTTLTGSASLPALASGEFFEIRDSSTVGNNGLYIATGSPTTSSVPCTKVVGPNPTDLSAESTSVFGTTGASSEKSVHFDTPTKTFYLLEQGNLSADGVTMLALHSFMKVEWKSDDFLSRAAGFLMVGISFAAGQWVFGQDPSGNNNGWKPAEDNGTHSILTRRLIRNAGWEEINSSGITLRKYFNVTTLPTSGAFEDPADQAYYRFGTDATDLGAAVDYEFTGEVNEPVKFFEDFGNPTGCDFATSSTITRSGGSFITDGYVVGGQVTVSNADQAGNNGTHLLTAVAATTLTVSGTPFTTGTDSNARLAVDNDNFFETFLRIRDADPNGKTYAKGDLAAAGETSIIAKKIPIGLSNATDLAISETDANIAANTPYTEIRIRYLDGTYNREVDSTTKRDFGIVIDVGTYSRQNGTVVAASDRLDSANHVLGAGEALADYANGTLIIHEGTDQGSYTISGTPVDNAGTLEITVTGDLTGSDTDVSFTMQRATPIVATKNEIYEKVQYQLRQAADIDDTHNTVNGKTADELAVFEGSNLRWGKAIPTNPNGGGSGVIVEGFDANDTNSLFFFDNGGTQRNFPFVAAGNIVVNQGLVDDTDGEAWLYYEYTRRTTNSDIDAVGPSGDTYDLEGTLGTYLVNDYLQISGFADPANNGLFIVTVVNVSGSDYTVRKVDGSPVGGAETDQTVSVDENPYPSPDAIIVNNNAGSPIAFNISALSTAFDFDYENNVQGGRTADTDAAVILVVAGLETGQVARTPAGGLTITKATGLTFSITSALERNFLNP